MPRPPFSTVALSSLTAGTSMALLYALHHSLSHSFSSSVVASIGSSAVLLFCAPAAPFSQPRNVIGGHLLACSAGLSLRHLPILCDQPLLLSPSALALACLAMQMTNTLHPPAGATALIATTTPLDLYFAIPVYCGAVNIVASAICLNRVTGIRYPV